MHQRKPVHPLSSVRQDEDHRGQAKVYLEGGGIASIAAAAFPIRNCDARAVPLRSWRRQPVYDLLDLDRRPPAVRKGAPSTSVC